MLPRRLKTVIVSTFCTSDVGTTGETVAISTSRRWQSYRFTCLSRWLRGDRRNQRWWCPPSFILDFMLVLFSVLRFLTMGAQEGAALVRNYRILYFFMISLFNVTPARGSVVILRCQWHEVPLRFSSLVARGFGRDAGLSDGPFLAVSLSPFQRRCVLPSDGDGRSDLELTVDDSGRSDPERTGDDDGQIKYDLATAKERTLGRSSSQLRASGGDDDDCDSEATMTVTATAASDRRRWWIAGNSDLCEAWTGWERR
ncbi:hypothetical protein TIFTF001_016729 [Ficus carica]|uniref:Uncharacterized protein n=1 Tax=Ficus carica TaxID=3494 RepID=A0AA88A3P3_FICCA|nr:hypothetical protein TIFTF001_016729 [Ficus carica]